MLSPLFSLYAQGEPGAPVWTVDPVVPGPDVPHAGASLFDRITTTADGQQLPFPFEHLIARIEAAAGCSELKPCTRAVLIPLGRSLQRVAASPQFYRHPRVVASVVFDGRGPFLLRDRLYLGYQDHTGVIEVISYNETLGRFEFQIVKDYVAGKTPKVVYARRTVCLSCHQNHSAIFSRQVWLETNANPRIASQLEREQPAFHGVAARGNSDIANAIDDASDRSNQLALVQRLWIEGCGTGEAGMECRRSALLASLQLALTGQRTYDTAADQFRSAVKDTLARTAQAKWPAGLAVPSPDIPNRDPLATPAGASGLALAHIDPRFDPLSPRSALEVLPVSGDGLSDRLIRGIAGFWSNHSREQLDQAMQRAMDIRVRRIKVPCRITAIEGQTGFECHAAAESASRDRLQFSGTLHGQAGTLDSLGIGAAQPVRHLQLSSINAQVGPSTGAVTFVPRAQDWRAHLPTGDTVQQIALHWSKNDGVATVVIHEDFAAIEKAVSGIKLDAAPLRSSLIGDIAARVAGAQPTPCCALSPHPTAVADEYVPASAKAHPLAHILESQCGACHHTAESAPPNFLSGDTRRVSRALQSCAPRILVRLAMRDLPPEQRDKTPMPPESFLPPVIGGRTTRAPDPKSLAAVRANIEAMLREEYGRLPTPGELLQHGYESLRPCLPPSD